MDIRIPNIGEFLKQKRKGANLTLRSVSETIGVTIGYLSRLENGSSKPSLETLNNLSHVLGFKLEDVCDTAGLDVTNIKEVDIEDLFQTVHIRVNNHRLSDKSKFQLLRLIKVIDLLEWKNEFDDISEIQLLFNQLPSSF